MTSRYRLLDIGWVLATNLFVLAGVIVWDWPAGNVFLVFWIENAILGVTTAVRIATAEGPVEGQPRSDSILRFPTWGRVGFFVVHYGIFSFVHLVFVTILAIGAGVEWSFWALGMPALLIALRYVVDLVRDWFLGGRRRRVNAEQAFWSPYPRLIVLHVATLLGFFVAFPFGSGGLARAPWSAAVDGVRAWLASFGYSLSTGVLLVALLMILKTVADLATIRGWTSRLRPAD
ncbi:DUF6498-containing protein [Micropruina sp.]|uniref:DUF6498-containing protein n=1 Tax=Micropruina sp. TaxID=2737536 RepID=UPI0039E311D8